MTTLSKAAARAVADLTEGEIVAAVEISASRERVFKALTTREIVRWWVRPGVFDTTDWTGEVRKGGRWRASGTVRGEAYVLEGEYLEVDPPARLVHTWNRVGAPGKPTTVTYMLEDIEGGTRLTLKHTGFTSQEACGGASAGWQTSFERLAALL